MGSSEVSSDWEEVQYPHSNHPSSPSAQEQQHLDLKLVIQENFYDDGTSIFPPREHEDLPVVQQTPLSPSALVLPDSDSETDPSPEQQQQRESDSKLLLIVTEIRAGISTTRRKMSAFVASCFDSHWRPSFVPAAALAVAIYACVKILQWRNRVLLLMREKDQRISQLLHHIAHMNEILSARRKVPVLRIN